MSCNAIHKPTSHSSPVLSSQLSSALSPLAGAIGVGFLFDDDVIVVDGGDDDVLLLLLLLLGLWWICACADSISVPTYGSNTPPIIIMISISYILVLVIVAGLSLSPPWIPPSASTPSSVRPMKNFSAEKSPPLDADSAEMESADMLDSLTQRSVLNRRYQQLQRRFVVISVLCGVFLLLSVIMVAVNVSNKGKSKSGSESGTSLPNASYCRAFMMSAVRAIGGGCRS